jgi:hypothetical protein
MHYEIIRDDREEYGPWRVSTRGYRYQISRIGQQDLARLHWHPTGASHYTEPHLHLPTVRATFEDAITWAAVLGMPMARDDWPEVLKQCQEKHLVHRSWH